ncbi:unnamed protein product [Pleuronectes platessa]|uniref:Uncharacterized protein n=1 Tax=Pleuronectes platessa TaxID=8262 RepID=A0A9N7Z7C5_PLEPL|nr:unnamed protein product [Pleuronectes platessa]
MTSGPPGERGRVNSSPGTDGGLLTSSAVSTELNPHHRYQRGASPGQMRPQQQDIVPSVQGSSVCVSGAGAGKGGPGRMGGGGLLKALSESLTDGLSTKHSCFRHSRGSGGFREPLYLHMVGSQVTPRPERWHVSTLAAICSSFLLPAPLSSQALFNLLIFTT